MSTTTKTATGLSGKYLTFALHHESYGIDVLKVREIIRVTSITAVPQMPDYVRGVINLRGKIIPVMDLRKRFDFPVRFKRRRPRRVCGRRLVRQRALGKTPLGTH